MINCRSTATRKIRAARRTKMLKKIKHKPYYWRISSSRDDGLTFNTSSWFIPTDADIVSCHMKFYSNHHVLYGYDYDRNRTWLMRMWKKPIGYYNWKWNARKW